MCAVVKENYQGKGILRVPHLIRWCVYSVPGHQNKKRALLMRHGTASVGSNWTWTWF